MRKKDDTIKIINNILEAKKKDIKVKNLIVVSNQLITVDFHVKFSHQVFLIKRKIVHIHKHRCIALKN